MRRVLPIVLVAAVLIPVGAIQAGADRPRTSVHHVIVPAADRFAPFAVTIHAGDAVLWVNNDEDDHAVVSDDPFTTAGHRGTDEVISADGGTFALRFTHPGTFLYYCRFHAHLDEFSQPVAPGPDGGIQDPNGNFGTPMSGVVTVLPDD